jgi:two-component system, NarL family, response regulator LiaR
MTQTISVQEDANSFSKTLTSIINANGNMHVSKHYDNSEEAIVNMQNSPIDIAIIDIQLPGISGIDIIASLQPLLPNNFFLMCSGFDDDNKLLNSLQAFASGYVLQTNEPQNIVSHMKDTITAGQPMSKNIAIKIVKCFQATSKPENTMRELTAKENEILVALSKGYLYKEIATQHNIMLDTVKKHCGNIYKKLGVSNKTEAINFYLRRR